jgi:hypothetical protein
LKAESLRELKGNKERKAMVLNALFFYLYHKSIVLYC